jgi:hypothetical protein
VCTNGYGAPGFWSIGPELIDPAFPSNGMFAVSGDSWILDGQALEVAADAATSAKLGMDVFRPVQQLQPGDALGYWAEHCEPVCSYCPSDCDGYGAKIAAPDLVAPTMPELTVHTLLVRDPEGAGGWSCGDSDLLEIQISVTDDIAVVDRLGLVAYIAPTAVEVGLLTTPSAVLGLDYSYEPRDGFATTTVVLGDAVGHVRTGDSPFVSKDPICFALAAFDRSGNLGERSYVACVDTDDPDDPSVIWVSSQGCGCQTGAGAGLGTALLVAAVTVALTGRGHAGRRGNGSGTGAPQCPRA